MKVHFHGAAGEVTGSCHLLVVRGHRILIDCGMIQGRPSDEARNHDNFPCDPASVDAVILSHAHIDHSGRIPLLVKDGFRGHIHTHSATRDLCRIMLKDSAYLNERDAEWENKKRMRRHLPMIEPLYTTRDAARAMRRFKTLQYDQIKEIVPGVKVRFQDAGHILGSAIIEIFIEEDGIEKKLVFSGDLGLRNAPILRDVTEISQADAVIMESTYGDRLHRSMEETLDEIAKVFEQAQAGKGNILIPAFAIGRTQELLYLFGKYFDDWNLGQWQIFLDSPLAIDATEVYMQHSDLFDDESLNLWRENKSIADLPNLYFSKTASQSMGLNQINSGAIIIAGSGMCNGGRIRHHFKHNLWRENCHVLISGFQAAGTLGRRIVDGAEHVHLWGESIRVAANIHTIGGLSAHADQAGLVNWYQAFKNVPPVTLVHGEQGSLNTLRDQLQQGGANRVSIAAVGDVLDLASV